MSSMIKVFDSHETLSFQSVPRQMVHKSALTEVFLTEGIRLEPDHFQCGVQLPRTNMYFNDCLNAYHEMLLLIELFRQASIYVSHEYIEVSIADKFLYVDSDTGIDNRNALLVGEQPTVGVIDVLIVDKYYRRNVLQGVTFDMKLMLDGAVVAHHDGMSIRWMSEELWSRMREKGLSRVAGNPSSRSAPVTPANPRTVGRNLNGNVVIGEDIKDSQTELEADLVIPLNNRAIFDHSLDHLPGMLLLEAFRQTALTVAAREMGVLPEELVLERCSVKFEQFGEFGCRTTCRTYKNNLMVDSENGVICLDGMSIEQEGVVIAKASLSFTNLMKTSEGRGLTLESIGAVS